MTRPSETASPSCAIGVTLRWRSLEAGGRTGGGVGNHWPALPAMSSRESGLSGSSSRCPFHLPRVSWVHWTEFACQLCLAKCPGPVLPCLPTPASGEPTKCSCSTGCSGLGLLPAGVAEVSDMVGHTAAVCIPTPTLACECFYPFSPAYPGVCNPTHLCALLPLAAQHPEHIAELPRSTLHPRRTK